MSKSHVPSTDGKKKKVSNHVEHMVKVAKAQSARLKAVNIIGCIFFGIAMSLYCGWIGGSLGVGSCLLYIFAFDGKVSGRMDGNVLMRNGRGRGFVVPSLVQNGNTTTARSLLAQFSQGFRSLTSIQIAAWNAFEMTISNRFGQTKKIKGKTCYVRLNCNLVNIGVAPITDPPVLEDVPGVTSLTPTITTSTLSLAFAPTPTDTNVSHKIFATKNLSPGVSRPSLSQFRFIDVLQPGTATPYSAFTAYSARFGAPTSGSNIFIRLVPVNITTGQEGVAIEAFDTVS